MSAHNVTIATTCPASGETRADVYPGPLSDAYVDMAVALESVLCSCGHPHSATVSAVEAPTVVNRRTLRANEAAA